MTDGIEIDAKRAGELLAAGAQLIDVREDYEVEAGRIAGSRQIAMGSLPAAQDTLDRDRPIVFYCRVGGRSAVAANAFNRAGFEAYTLGGGILEYAAGQPIEGTVADH